MRLSRLVFLGVAVAALTGCEGDEINDVGTPPLAAVRIVNALSEGQAIDVRAIDQVEWSPVANLLAYRGTTVYYATEAKARRLRIFPTSTDATVTSQVLADSTITFAANSRITLMVVGSVAGGNVRFLVIDDDVTAPPSGQIAVRLVNASGAAIDGGLVTAVGDALPSPRTWTNVGARAAGAYINRATGAAAVRTAAAGSGTVLASAVGPTAPTSATGQLPGAGINSAGTKFSVYYFPAISAIAASQGRPAVAATAASLVWQIDRNPAD